MRLTRRIGRIKPSPTIAIDTKAKQMKAEGVDVVSFGAGEPDFDTPEHIKEAAREALARGQTKYTAVGGIPELKKALVAKFKRDSGLDYTADEVMVSCGGKHVLFNAMLALFQRGDEVLISAPYWVSYPDQVLLADAKPVILPTREEDGFKLRAEELEKAIGPKTRGFILNSPSNPTGAAYTRSELALLAEVLVRHQLFTLSDEIYEKLVYDGFEQASIASLHPAMKDQTLVVNGASKVYSMTGWRMGFAAGPKELIGAMTKMQSQSTTNVNSITQWATIAALNGPQGFLDEWRQIFKERRDTILDRFRKIPGVTCHKPEGAFYVFPNVKAYLGKRFGRKAIRSSDALATYLLDEAKVAVVAGEGFGAPGYIRLSYATSMENITKGLDRIEAALANLH